MSDRLTMDLIVGGVTAIRLLVLAVTPTDLFFDEAQYWAWSRDFDWGYFSKPPLIAWIIGATTGLAGSDAAFWVRAPAPIFHGLTALILAGWIGQIHRPAAPWVAATYLAMPILAVGSWMISTDTIMAPFLAAALWSWWRSLETRKWQFAALAGGLAGVAMMAKYAGVYFWLAVAVSMLFSRLRPTPGALAAAGIACLVVIAPNLLWNAGNGLVTFAHTADNAQVGRDMAMNWPGLASFLVAQAVVIGPVFFVVWLGAMARRDLSEIETFLLAASVPVLLLVCVQAFIAKANANWAFAAYPAAAAFVGLRLSRLGRPRLFAIGLAVNLVPILAVTALIVWPDIAPKLTDRYTGRTALMTEILAQANGRPVVADERQILADLTYAARRDGAPPVFANGRWDVPRHWYDMVAPQPTDRDALLVSDRAALECAGIAIAPEATMRPVHGAYAGRAIHLYPLPAGCS